MDFIFYIVNNHLATKHESLGSKLKTVDFTAKETGDTLEELLKLLDPELQDKKRGQVDKTNNTQLDEEAKNKLASLTKKAEDEVDKLASQNPKPKTGCSTLYFLFCSLRHT